MLGVDGEIMITAQEKQEIIQKFGQGKNTGCPEVQVAILTKRINNLAPHFSKHDGDYSSNRGLLKMIGQRKNILRYLQAKDVERYNKIITALDLRK